MIPTFAQGWSLRRRPDIRAWTSHPGSRPAPRCCPGQIAPAGATLRRRSPGHPRRFDLTTRPSNKDLTASDQLRKPAARVRRAADRVTAARGLVVSASFNCPRCGLTITPRALGVDHVLPAAQQAADRRRAIQIPPAEDLYAEAFAQPSGWAAWSRADPRIRIGTPPAASTASHSTAAEVLIGWPRRRALFAWAPSPRRRLRRFRRLTGFGRRSGCRAR